MISSQQLAAIKQDFSGYTASFTLTTDAQREAFTLKIDHTFRVCDIIRDLALSLRFSESDLNLAEITGLLHDIGRFEQYIRYNTFADRKSENHGRLGSTITQQRGLLDSLDEESQAIVLRAVENHNLFAIAPDITGKSLLFAQLVRDADKIDIFQICSDYYLQSGRSPHKVIEVGLPDLPHVTDSIIESCCSGIVAPSGDVVSLNDFKLLQLSWVYDLHFPRAFQIVRDKGYLRLIGSTLPHNEKTRKALDCILLYAKANCGP